MHRNLFPFQKRIVQWALRKGRAALFEDTGLGKTAQQLEWAKHVSWRTGKHVLIFAPLGVAKQTVREGEKWGHSITYVPDQAAVPIRPPDQGPRVFVTNYERAERFSPETFGGLVLDESGILKGFDGKFRRFITQFGSTIPFRLACTATPAPNDLHEIINHAEFLGVMDGKEILALFFIQDGNTTHKWKLKGHAKQDFWRWMASWCVALRKPSDLDPSYDDTGYDLPPLQMEQIVVEAPDPTFGLFAVEARTMSERRIARRESTDARVKAAADLVNGTDEPFLIWCDLNRESEALAKAIPGAVEVKGADPQEHKERSLLGFADGSIRVLVTKPSIAGFGMNWQHCSRMAFVGLSDSFEAQYQAIRRCWRFGQTQPVHVSVITAETEGAVLQNIERKAAQAREMMDSLIAEMQGLQLDGATRRTEAEYAPALPMSVPQWLRKAA
jgi:hypothetical protein